MEIEIINPQDQANGEFDGGKIIEQKPIGFSGEGSLINRLGPLFYWAWAQPGSEGGIGFHPHKGFEIITYIINGKGNHQDTLGNSSVVGAGGVQLMQTGSGVQHAESLLEPTEAFQIWLEPYLNEAVMRPPTYSKYVHEDFSTSSENGLKVKTILGKTSPIKIVTDAKMFDVEIANGVSYKYSLSPNRILAGLAIRGDGVIMGEQAIKFALKDFVVVQSGEGGQISIEAGGHGLRICLIEVPAEVNYPLYRKPR